MRITQGITMEMVIPANSSAHMVPFSSWKSASAT